MNKISVKNYRSIVDSGEIEILPITAIVGKNSAGKSSFLRIFPLLKQTLERNVSDPILWYGDYVDFGNYSNAISKKYRNEAIEFCFSLNINNREFNGRYKYNSRIMNYDATVSISIREKYYEKITIIIYDQKIEICISDSWDIESISVNGNSTIFEKMKLCCLKQNGDLLPIIFEKKENEYDDNKLYLKRIDLSSISKIAKKQVYGNSKVNRNDYYFSMYDEEFEFELNDKEHILSILKEKNEKKFGNMTLRNQKFIKANDYIMASYLMKILSNINQSILREIRQTNYIKPIRAMVDRYYRVQGISIDELDADGSNLPMILYNMSNSDLKKFEKWSNEKFGVIFSVSKSSGHVSLIIKDDLNDDGETNMTDTGYGYSQMLPIVVLLWMLHNKMKPINRINVSRTIVIEQPELHLHPAYQAKMIDIFVNIVKEAKNRGLDLKIIFETHSEAMINRIGRLISAQKLDQSWVNILVFDKDNDITKITSKKFNEKGLLIGWPMGFFSAEEV